MYIKTDISGRMQCLFVYRFFFIGVQYIEVIFYIVKNMKITYFKSNVRKTQNVRRMHINL